MAVIYSREMLDELARLLDGVGTVGQAQAAVSTTLAMANRAREEISQWIFETSWRKQAKEDLRNKGEALLAQAAQIRSGDLAAQVGPVWTAQLRGTCLDLWLYAILVQGQFPPDETSAWERYKASVQGSYDDLRHGVGQAPSAIVGAVSTIARTVGESAEGLLSGVLGPLKWYLLGAVAILGVAGVVAYRKGLL